MIFYISLTAIVASVILTILNWRINKSFIFLALFLAPISLYAIVHYLVIYDTGHRVLLAILYNNFAPLYFLPGPMLYFYVRSNLQDKAGLELYKSDIFHVIPFIFNLIGIIPYVFSSFAYKLHIAALLQSGAGNFLILKVNWLVPPAVNYFARPILLLAYSIFAAISIIRFTLKPLNNTSPILQQKIMIRWLTVITIIGLLVGLGYFFGVLPIYINHLSLAAIQSLPMNYVVGFAFFFIPVSLIVFPQLNYGIPQIKKNSTNSMNTASKLPGAEATHLPDIGTNQNDLVLLQQTADPFTETAAAILLYLQTNQPYLDPEFNIDMLAAHMQLPKHHLYYCFNTLIQVRFTVLKRTLRVEYAKKLLESDTISVLSIDGIGLKSGFSSRTTFFVSFKEVTGKTPKEYIEFCKITQADK